MSRPRSPVVRGIFAGGIALAIIGGWQLVRYGLVVPLVGRNNPVADILSLVYPVVVTGAIASLVSYRFIDGLVWLVPPFAFVLVVRVAWRFALLPFRDWEPASKEVSRVKMVRVSGGGSRSLYVLQPKSATASGRPFQL